MPEVIVVQGNLARQRNNQNLLPRMSEWEIVTECKKEHMFKAIPLSDLF